MENKTRKNNKNKKNNNNANNKESTNKENSKDKVKYFLMFPLEEEAFTSSYKNLCSELEKNSPTNFDIHLLQKPQKLHLTILVLDINENPEKTAKIISSINSLIKDIKEIVSDELIFNFEKYDTFDQVTKTRVIYAKMLEDENHYKLKLITDKIIKKLLEENVMTKTDLKKVNVAEENVDGELRYVVKFHMTIMNTKYLNKFLEKEGKSLIYNIDSTDILRFIKNIKLPECPINKINLCAMREDNEKYEIINSFNIN